MGEVTSLFARKVVAAAGEEIDPREILRSVNLDPDGPWDPKLMLAEDTYYDMLELMAQRMADISTLPLIVGESMRPDEYGALGLAWKAAPNLLGSFTRVARYARLWTSIAKYELIDTDDGILFVEHRDGKRRLGLRISVEADLASGVSLSRQVTDQSFAPLAVYFKHPAPKSIDQHEIYFACDVHFGAKQDAMLLSRESLDRATALGDEGITRFLMSHLDQELSEIKDEPSLGDRTKEAIAKALSEGPPRMEDIARELGFSARSFHRRLAEHGLKFHELAEQTRRELAEGLLIDAQCPLSDVAFLTGFSEQSAFSRAFKRWVGQTPASYRKAHALP